MPFILNRQLLEQQCEKLSQRENLFWLIGGAGSGKSTICGALTTEYGTPIYDMDAHIYGAYHGRFTDQRHPVNKAWSTAANGLAWLLTMSWEQFNSFNQAALPEYLDLLAEDLESTDPDEKLLIDGGIVNPALLAQVIPPRQLVCLSAPGKSSAAIWEASAERQAMKEMIFQLPQPEEMWRTFLEFDRCITDTILKEAHQSNIQIITINEGDSVADTAEQTAAYLGY